MNYVDLVNALVVDVLPVHLITYMQEIHSLADSLKVKCIFDLTAGVLFLIIAQYLDAAHIRPMHFNLPRILQIIAEIQLRTRRIGINDKFEGIVFVLDANQGHQRLLKALREENAGIGVEEGLDHRHFAHGEAQGGICIGIRKEITCCGRHKRREHLGLQPADAEENETKQEYVGSSHRLDFRQRAKVKFF